MLYQFKSKLHVLGLIGLISLSYATGVTPASASNPADPNKIVRQAFEGADDGFDMAKTQNHYSGWVADAIFEPLLGYDYLARPAKLVPKTVEAMPEVSDEGKVFIFKIIPGICFSPDEAFKGKKHELIAQDYVYSFKRILDPANRSPHASFIDGKIVGMDEVQARAKKTNKFDYDMPVAGLRAIDKYTLRIELKKLTITSYM